MSACAALLACAIAPPCRAQAQTWIEDTFEDFSDGTLDAAGQNIYASRDGRIRTINRFDLNDDGHIDLLFNCTHNTYQMLPATAGSVARGRKASSVDVAVEGSQRVALHDLNGDGFTDIVFCPNGIGVAHPRRLISVAWGGPDGWPASRVSGALPMNGATAIDVADLNADKWPDIVVLGAARWRVEQPAGNIVRIYWGSQGGYLATEMTDVGVPAAIDLVAADLGGNQSRDVAVLRSDGQVTILWSAIQAGQAAEPSQSVAALPAADATCVAAADVNNDGLLELVAGSSSGSVYLLAAAPDRQWQASTIAAFPATHIALGELDADGHVDLVLTHFMQARAAGGEQAGAQEEKQSPIHILWGGPDGFSAERSAGLDEKYATAAAVGDLDADGNADLAVAVHQAEGTFNGESAVYFGDGQRSFVRGESGFGTSGATHVAIAAADMDMPARAVFANSIGGRFDEAVPLHVYWGGREGFDPKRVWKIPFHSGYEASAADLNADGHTDLIALNSGHAGEISHDDPTLGLNIFWGGPDGFDLERRRTVIREHFLGTSNTADLDRDGYLDLVLEPFGPEQAGKADELYIYMGSADGFDPTRRIALEKTGYSQEHILADFNDDQWLDIAVTSRTYNCVRIYWGGPRGFDAARDARLKISGPVGADAADLNADGFLDIIASSYDDPVSTVRDMGSAIFWGGLRGYQAANSQWLPGFSPLGRTVADFDGDGRLDLFSPQHSGELTREDLACHIYWAGEDGFATRRRTTLVCDSVCDSMAGDFNSDGLIDLAVACHTRHGDHRTQSRVFYNDGHRFKSPRVQLLPTNGTHLMWAMDMGHIANRGWRQSYESSVFELEKGATSGRLRYQAEKPEGTHIDFEVRSFGNSEQLAQQPWRAVEKGRFSLAAADRQLQYRAVLVSDNGDRYPVLDRVEIKIGRK